MKILHITDFHFSNSESLEYNQERLVKSLAKSLKSEKNIDFVFFTGDLVNGGNESFLDADKLLFDNLLSELKISKSNIFFCEGNHDLVRTKEMKAITSEINTFSNNSEIDDFVSKKDQREFEESLRNHEGFYEYQTNFYKNTDDTIRPLFSVHKRRLGDKSIGIATLNSSWRCKDSNTDSGNLIFPLVELKKVTKLLADVDSKILLMHHPLSDFKYFNSTELEDIIFEEFNYLFAGHVHKKKQSTHVSNTEGIFYCVAPASLSTYESLVKTGYTILNIDTDSLEIFISNKVYDKQDNIFLQGSEIKVHIPVNKDKEEQNSFRKKIRKKYELELELANELLLNTNENSTNQNFIDLFTDPILKNHPSSNLKQKKNEIFTVNIDELYKTKGSYILLGKDKCGKTSILTRIKLELLNNFSKYKSIPFHIDCHDFKSLKKSLDILTLISRYYEINKSNTISKITEFHLILLIDNFDSNNEFLNEGLRIIFETYSNSSFIATSEETISRDYENLSIDGKGHSNLFIHPITRKEVRLLANKWPNLSYEKKELVLDKIGDIFFQMNIPMNFWTASLFIWIYEKNAESNFHNNVDLINLYVDGILERTSFGNKSKITFDDFKIFISELAYFLIKNFSKSGYTASYSDITTFVSGYREKNIKFVIGVKEIIEILLEKGIVKKGEDENYSFRLNGVFEYFVAYYMNDNHKFRNKILSDDHFYLSFSNEFELCSGFNRRDKEFLELIFKKTQKIFHSTNKKYSSEGQADDNLQSKIKVAIDIASSLSKMDKEKLKLTPEKQDELLIEFNPIEVQNAEVQRKKYYESIEINPENLEKALLVLSRVYRNSNINDKNLNNDVLDFILECACNLGFVLIDDFENSSPNIFEDDEDEKLLMQIMTNFMPLIIQTFLFDALAQNNLERIVLLKIEELKEKDDNQFKLLLLYFLLIDLNLKANHKYLDNILDFVKIGSLKQTILAKLYFYLSFKTYNDKNLEDEIIKKLEKTHQKIDPNYKVDVFRKKVADQKKKNIVERKKLK